MLFFLSLLLNGPNHDGSDYFPRLAFFCTLCYFLETNAVVCISFVSVGSSALVLRGPRWWKYSRQHLGTSGDQ